MPEESKEFLERRELQKQDEKISKLKHKNKMEELEFMRETDRLRGEENRSFHRLKRADKYRELGIRP